MDDIIREGYTGEECETDLDAADNDDDEVMIDLTDTTDLERAKKRYKQEVVELQNSRLKTFKAGIQKKMKDKDEGQTFPLHHWGPRGCILLQTRRWPDTHG